MQAHATESRILQAAAELLEQHGPEGVTTRLVCQAAGITAPTLYHHFGDKRGLVRRLVGQGLADFMAMKRNPVGFEDGLDELRQGWEDWIAFGMERPQLFRLMIEAAHADPTAMNESFERMQAQVARLDAQGRLKVDATQAGDVIWAAATGVQAMFLQRMAPARIHANSGLLFRAVIAAVVVDG